VRWPSLRKASIATRCRANAASSRAAAAWRSLILVASGLSIQVHMREGFKSDVITLGLLEHVGFCDSRLQDAVVWRCRLGCEEHTVNNVIWRVGASVIILAILRLLRFRRKVTGSRPGTS
jgi:hypothetical protein